MYYKQAAQRFLIIRKANKLGIFDATWDFNDFRTKISKSAFLLKKMQSTPQNLLVLGFFPIYLHDSSLE